VCITGLLVLQSTVAIADNCVCMMLAVLQELLLHSLLQAG
jgi:hypothetical protein